MANDRLQQLFTVDHYGQKRRQREMVRRVVRRIRAEQKKNWKPKPALANTFSTTTTHLVKTDRIKRPNIFKRLLHWIWTRILLGQKKNA